MICEGLWDEKRHGIFVEKDSCFLFDVCDRSYHGSTNAGGDKESCSECDKEDDLCRAKLFFAVKQCFQKGQNHMEDQ